MKTSALKFSILLISCGCFWGCNRETDDPGVDQSDLALSYQGEEPSDGTHGELPPYDMCYLTGPHETLVVARMKTDFESTLYGPCEAGGEFFHGFHTTDLEILRTEDESIPPTIQRSVWFFSPAEVNAGSSTPAGTTYLVSLRKAGEDWIAMGAVEVEPNQNAEPSSSEVATRSGYPITLPPTWSAVVAEAASIRDDYRNSCPSLAGLMETDYMGGGRLMTDEEFDTLVHTRNASPNCDQQIEEPEPGPEN